MDSRRYELSGIACTRLGRCISSCALSGKHRPEEN